MRVIGIDLAKNTFSICALDNRGNPVKQTTFSRKKLTEFISTTEKCLIAIEACGGAHYWARIAKASGHEVKMMSPQYVKPFVKSNKNDVNDAFAIAEAALRPSIPSVPIKCLWQQDVLAMHRFKERLVKNKTELTNQTRGLLMEYGIVFRQGDAALCEKVAELIAPKCEDLSPMMKTTLADLREELSCIQERLQIVKHRITQLSKSDDRCRRILKIPGIGPITATALVASIGNGADFKNGRHVAAWLGLVPKHSGTGGVVRIRGISKRGDKYLRKLLIQGAHTVVRWSKLKDSPEHQWLRKKYSNSHPNFAAVALANKMARMVWIVLSGKEEFCAVRGFALTA